MPGRTPGPGPAPKVGPLAVVWMPAFFAPAVGALIACAADYRTIDPTAYFFIHMPWRPDGAPITQAQRDSVGRTKAQLMAGLCRCLPRAYSSGCPRT